MSAKVLLLLQQLILICTGQTLRDCSDSNTVCLQGGPKGKEDYVGNVMVGGSPVCDDGWNIVDANVVCRELGLTKAKKFFRKSKFGNTSSTFRMDEVNCNGTEQRLIDCKHLSKDNCNGGEAAGVECYTTYYQEILNNTCFEGDLAYSDGDSEAEIPNIESAAACQHLCQVSHTCTDFTYDLITRICFLKTKKTKYFAKDTISGPKFCKMKTTTRDCNSTGVVCLMQGDFPDEGNVYLGGRPVCDDSWDYRDAKVVCRELGYPDIFKPFTGSHFGSVKDNFAMDNVECKGTETSLKLCKHSTTDDCGTAEGAGVKCFNGTIIDIPQYCHSPNRICLVGGSGNHEGNVYYQGKPVCDDGWTVANARIVCKSLGFKEAEQATRGSDFGLVPSDFSDTSFHCQGNEENLQSCGLIRVEENCKFNRYKGAGVICINGAFISSTLPTVVLVVTLIILLVFGLLVFFYFNRIHRRLAPITNDTQELKRIVSQNYRKISSDYM